MPRNCACKKRCCKCDVFNCLTVTGDACIAGDLTVSGTLSVTTLEITGQSFDLCNQNVFLSQITACTPSGIINVNGSLSVQGTTTVNNLVVCSLTSCNGSTITFNNQGVFTQGLLTNTLGAISGSLTVTSPTIFDQTVSFCSSVQGCGGQPVTFTTGITTNEITTPIINMTGPGTINGNVTFTGAVTVPNSPITACIGVVTNNISSCAGNLHVNSPTVFSSNVSICSGTLSVATITACAGSINITSPTTVTNLTVTGTLSTNTISPVIGTVVTVNGSVTANGVNTCGGPLTVSQINPCASGTITVGGNVVVTGSITISNLNINQLTNPVSITLNTPTTIIGGNLDVCSGIAFINNISPCPGSTGTTFAGSITAPSVITPLITSGTGTVTIASNLTVTGVTTSCAGVITNSLDNCFGPGINVNSNLIITAGNTLQTNTISSAGAASITVTTNTVFNGTVTICSQPLSVAVINSCTPGVPVTINPGINTGSVTTNNIFPTVPGGTVNVNGNLNVTGNITGNIPNTFCTSGIIVSSINPCPGLTTIPITAPIVVPAVNTVTITGTGPGGSLTINGPTTFTSPATFNQPISVTTINPVGAIITINGTINGCAANFNLSTITACGGGLTIAGATTFTGTTNFCSNPMMISTILSCGTPVQVDAGFYILPARNLFVNNIQDTSTQPGGVVGITFTTATATFTGDVNVCSGTLSVATLSGCAGNPIIITSPVSFCPGGITTQIINPCAPGDILINSTIAPQAIDVYPGNTSIILLANTSLCSNNSTLFGNTISPCAGGGTNTFTDNVSICSGNLRVLNITACPGNTQVNVIPNLSLCTNNSILFTNQIQSCAPGGTITITGNTTITGTVTAAGFSLTNVNASGTGTSLLGPLVGPGGNTRSFKTLTSTGGTILITSTATQINLEAVTGGAGTVTGGANEGGGAVIFDPVNSTPVTLVFKTLTSTGGTVTITPTAQTVNLEAGTVTGGVNLGAGAFVFSVPSSTPTTLAFRSLISSDGSILITQSPTDIDLVSLNSGTVTGGINLGGGTIIFSPAASTPTTLAFKTLTSTNGSVVITNTANTVNLATLNNGTVTNGANEGGGIPVFDGGASTPTTLIFRTLTSTGGTVTITNVGTTVNLEAGTVLTGSNLGAGTAVFSSGASTPTNLAFKTLTSTNGSVVITNTANTVNLSTLNNGTVTTGANEGGGTAIFDPANSTATTLVFKTLTSTNGSVVITNTATTVNLSTLNNGTVTTGTNVGTGAGVFDLADSTASTLAFRRLESLNANLTIVQGAQTIDFDYNVDNTTGGFNYTGALALVVPPNTWTDIPAPVQTNATPGYTVVGDTISSIYMRNSIFILINVNVNGSPSSLDGIGATWAFVRVLNGGIIRGYFPIPVFPDPSGTFQSEPSVRFDFTTRSANIVNFTLEFWHNGTVPYTDVGVTSVTFVPS